MKHPEVVCPECGGKFREGFHATGGSRCKAFLAYKSTEKDDLQRVMGNAARDCSDAAPDLVTYRKVLVSKFDRGSPRLTVFVPHWLFIVWEAYGPDVELAPTEEEIEDASFEAAVAYFKNDECAQAALISVYFINGQQDDIFAIGNRTAAQEYISQCLVEDQRSKR